LTKTLKNVLEPFDTFEPFVTLDHQKSTLFRANLFRANFRVCYFRPPKVNSISGKSISGKFSGNYAFEPFVFDFRPKVNSISGKFREKPKKNGARSGAATGPRRRGQGRGQGRGDSRRSPGGRRSLGGSPR
jgi:hypothetical protein